MVMALGVKQAVSGGYTRVFSDPTGPTAKPAVLIIVGVALFLLTVRFFWVPRSLSAYAVVTKTDQLTSRFTRLMGFHFPIVMVHAMLFYTICQIFDDLATYRLELPAQAPAVHAATAHVWHLETRLVVIYGALLALNAIWLMSSTDRRDPMPGWFWALNNSLFFVLAVVAWFALHDASEALRVGIVAALFATNGVIDLVFTSEYYVLFYGDIKQPRRIMRAVGAFVESPFRRR